VWTDKKETCNDSSVLQMGKKELSIVSACVHIFHFKTLRINILFQMHSMIED